MKPTLLVVAIAFFIFGCANTLAGGQDSGPTMIRDTSAGEVLTTPSGMTLYTYDKDQHNASNCTGSCAQNWPPFAAQANDQASDDFSTIKRKDGSMQWTYEGKPLYTFVGDKAAGDANGNGIGGVWHVVPAEEAYQEGGYGDSY